jgi:hypothetical protein
VTTLNNGSLIAGKANPLLLSSGVPGVALDGALLYANNATGHRVGSYTDSGAVFKPFAGCGLNAHGQIAGVVHHQLISCNVSHDLSVSTIPRTKWFAGDIYWLVLPCSDLWRWICHSGGSCSDR